MLLNLARMSTATTGAGTITLGSAVTGFLSFVAAGAVDGRTYRYAIRDGANSEIGYGVYTSSGTTFTRNVIKSTNSDNAISLSGSAEIFITAGAEDFIGGPALTPSQVTADTNDYSPTNGAKYSTWLLDVDDDGTTFTGIATGWFGRFLTLQNIGTKTIKLAAASGSSSAGNRFNMPNDAWLLPKAVIILWYNGTNWQVLVMPTIGKKPIWFPAGAWTPRTTAGAASVAKLEMSTNKWNFPYLAFDPSATESADTFWPAIVEWDKGTVTFQYVWTHPSTSTNFGVSFGLAGNAFTNDDAGDTAPGTRVQVVDTGGTTSDIYVSPVSAAVTIANTPATEDLIALNLNRKHDEAGDTMAVDAYFIGMIMWINCTAPQAG